MYKKYCRTLITTLLYSLSLIYAPATFAQIYGLQFQGNDVVLDERTELNLTPDEFINLHDEFELSFYFKAVPSLISSNRGLFGYIFRIINQDNVNVDLLSSPTPIANFNVVVGKSNSTVSVRYPNNSFNSWIKLRVKFLLSEDRMIFYTPDSSYIQNNVGFKRKDDFKIIFGANDYIPFKSTDVPSMHIKDVKLFNKGKLIHHWPLNEIENNLATDLIKGQVATVKNPIWLRRSHQSWKEVFQRKIEGPIVFASDPENGKVFIVCAEELMIYSILDDQIQTIKYTNRPPIFNAEYRAFYNSRDNNIYCYLLGKNPLMSLNITTGEWSEIPLTTDFKSNYKRQSQYHSIKNNSVFIFGGYGRHEYNNEIRKINFDDNSIAVLPTNDSIFNPRYLAGLGALNDTIYILGGYGSETGNQLINPHSYYDLIGYSIKDSSLFEKFEIQHLVNDMIVANSMWIDDANRDYFALIFDKTRFDGHLTLIKGNLDSPEIESVGGQIPFQFIDIRSYADLFYAPQLKKLFALSSYFDGSTSTNTSIYSISYPPNLSEDKAKTLNKKNNTYWYLGIVFVLLLGGVIVIIRKKKGKGVASESSENNQGKFEKDIVQAKAVYQLIFFGGFQVYNKSLEDITSKFSPLLKELFLLVLLHTLKNNKGISSEKITEVLWYDKSERSARNNRSVNIARLRSILEEIGTCELSKKTGYWKIIFHDSDIKSDYIDFLQITASKQNLTKQKVNQLIDITEKGAFLSNVNYEWLDEFKSPVSDSTIDSLVEFAKSIEIKKEAEFVVHIADNIFNFDVTNEDAMILKCRAQYCMGKHSHAKATYQKFFKEYVLMYGQEYEQSFIDILEI